MCHNASPFGLKDWEGRFTQTKNLITELNLSPRFVFLGDLEQESATPSLKSRNY
jgi:hypothetical protein